MERIRGWLPAVPAVVVAIVVGVIVGMPERAPDPLFGLGTAETPEVTTASITVHISGEVIRPGLVTLDERSRLADAVMAAGGATFRADLSGVNLAQRVADGDHLVIPAVGASGTEDQSSRLTDGRIAVNRATADELQALPGVGPVLAERIVAHRDANGRFETAEDLLDVSGIGERTLATLRDLIVVP